MKGCHTRALVRPGFLRHVTKRPLEVHVTGSLVGWIWSTDSQAQEELTVLIWLLGDPLPSSSSKSSLKSVRLAAWILTPTGTIWSF